MNGLEKQIYIYLTLHSLDGTVDRMTSALTDHNGLLLRLNASMSQADAEILADFLRSSDVIGYTLLTEVETRCLRDKLGIKSSRQRAALKHLISGLRSMSFKYFEEQVQQVPRSDRPFKTGSPCFTTPSSF